MRKKFILFALALLSSKGFSAEMPSAPQQALDRLMSGNRRYVEGKITEQGRDVFKREQLALGQAPFAVIVSCSDSRVPPEIIFDQGLGDTFIVRVAGNVLGSLEKESVLFGADALKASLIFVLGHSNCGAIKAALEGGEAIRDIPEVAKRLAPALKVKAETGVPRLEQVIKTNVEYVRDHLKAVPLLAQFIKENRLMIVGGYYELETGKVIQLKD
jgi:carbonic anhydrase